MSTTATYERVFNACHHRSTIPKNEMCKRCREGEHKKCTSMYCACPKCMEDLDEDKELY